MAKFLSVIILICFFQSSTLFGQTVSENHVGEKIVIYGDGSWRYYDANDPDDLALYEKSDLYKENSKLRSAKTKKEKLAKSDKIKKPKVKKPKTKKPKTKESLAEAKQKKLKNPKAKTKKSKSKKPKKKYAAKDESNAKNIDYNRKIKSDIIDIRDKQTIALEKERVANTAVGKYERELKTAKRIKSEKLKINKITARLKEAKLNQKSARAQNKVLLKQRRAYESILKKGGSSMAKSYAKVNRKYDQNFKIDPPKNQESVASRERKRRDVKEPTSKRERVKRQDSVKDFEESAESTPTAYVVSYPTSKPNTNQAAVENCSVAFQGKDDFSGKKRTDLRPGKFFSYTSDKMRRYFEKGDMIDCQAYMSSVSGGYKFICIELEVASETAQKSYGSIEKQGMLSLRLVDGTNINLYNNKTDYGFLDPIKKTVLYKAQYLIPNEHVKTLSKVDLDKVRLVWSTGYEDYTIYETDFIINQLNCLMQ